MADTARAARALRKAGVTYAVIADQLGYASEDAARAEVVPLLVDVTPRPALTSTGEHVDFTAERAA